MSTKFDEAVEKFYKAHQLSKTVNLLKMYLYNMNFTTDNLPGSKCVCKVFEIEGEPWDKKVLTSCKSDMCFYTKKALKGHFGTLANDLDHNADCYKCYQFCKNRYFKHRGDIKLRTKKRS